MATTEERIIHIVCDNLGVNKGEVTRNTSFQEDMGADSLDIVELVMELEEEFDITIPDEEAEKIKTVGQAIDYIEAKLKEKGLSGDKGASSASAPPMPDDIRNAKSPPGKDDADTRIKDKGAGGTGNIKPPSAN
ncbi:MAG: acyl carrier protein [Planctomycetes bacterium]|nr:acyl carrier protein [Planctomycetota bacterium]